MIQFSFGSNNLPQYTIEIYIGNVVTIQKVELSNEDWIERPTRIDFHNNNKWDGDMKCL